MRGEAIQKPSDMSNSGIMTVFVGADGELGFGCKVAAEWCKRHHDIEKWQTIFTVVLRLLLDMS